MSNNIIELYPTDMINLSRVLKLTWLAIKEFHTQRNKPKFYYKMKNLVRNSCKIQPWPSCNLNQAWERFNTEIFLQAISMRKGKWLLNKEVAIGHPKVIKLSIRVLLQSKIDKAYPCLELIRVWIRRESSKQLKVSTTKLFRLEGKDKRKNRNKNTKRTGSILLRTSGKTFQVDRSMMEKVLLESRTTEVLNIDKER